MNSLRNLMPRAIHLLAIALALQASHGQAQDARFALNGKLYLDDRISTRDATLHWQEYRLRLNPSYGDGARYKFYADIWARRLISASPFEKKPQDVFLREAYVELYGLFAENLDIVIGRQRVAWGAARRLNPTDNINPIQLEDFWHLSRYSARNALHVRYTAGRFRFSGVYLPQFAPASLPATKWLDLLMAGLPSTFHAEVPAHGTIGVLAAPLAVRRKYTRPDWTPNASTYALRAAADLGPLSLSMSWLRGPSHLPHLSGVEVAGKLSAFDPVRREAVMVADATLSLSYPIRQVFGFDAAVSVGGLGAWAEVAAFLPEAQLWATRRFSADPSPRVPALPRLQRAMPDTLTLDSRPFFKCTVGGDYRFPANLYLNLQYAHGLAHEEGQGNLHDYLVWVMEWTSSNARLKVAPLNGMLRVDSFDRLGATYALFLLPEITYAPIPNCKITLGAHLLLPAKQSKLYPARRYSEAFCKLLFSF